MKNPKWNRFAAIGSIMSVGSLFLLAACTSKPAAPSAATHSVVTQPPPAPPAVPVAPVEHPEGPDEILAKATAQPTAPFAGDGWMSLLDGKTLAGWKVTDFAGHGEVECTNGLVVLNMGDPFTGIQWTNPPPSGSYEVALDAMRVMGTDFFCGLTFPVRDSFCSLIVGGWGGGLVGLSSLDGYDASENETTHSLNFERGRWYRIRLRVTAEKIEVWIDQDKIINVATKDRRISLRPGDIELSKPFGICAWQTTAALREIRLRELP